MFHDALQKVNEGRRHKAPFKHLKGQGASVVYRRDHVAVKALTRGSDLGRVSFEREAPAAHVIAAHAALSAAMARRRISSCAPAGICFMLFDAMTIH